MPCDAVAMTTAQLTADTRLMLRPEYRDLLKNVIRSAAQANAYSVTAYDYTDTLYIQTPNATVGITRAGVVSVSVSQRRLTVDEALNMAQTITAALAALPAVLAQALTARTIQNLLDVRKTSADASGNITLTVSL